MRNTVRRLSIAILCVIICMISVVPAFAADTRSNYTPMENHDKIDCANRYVDGSNYKFLIKTVDDEPISDVYVEIYGENGLVNYLNLQTVANLPYCTLYFEYNHSNCNYYTLTVDTSNSAIPESLVHKIGICLYYDYYMATNTANGSFSRGTGYWLSR